MMGKASNAMIAMGIALGASVAAFGQSYPASAPKDGEVLLQISARGLATSPADLITVNIPLNASADTAIAARAAVQSKIDRLRKQFLAKGIAPGSISFAKSSGMQMGFISEPPEDDNGAPLPLPMAMTKKSAQSMLQLRLASAAQVEAVRDILDAENEGMMGVPVAALKDDRTAKRQAIADAVVKARAEADAYSEAFRMRILRVARISNQSSNSPDTNYAGIMQLIAGRANGAPNDVMTDAAISIDFVMAPR